jgi:transcriptional regulator with XRE-family HTH domain
MQYINTKNAVSGPLYAARQQMRATKKAADRSVLAANLKMLMERRDWTQRQLAEKAGMSQTHVGNLIRGDHDASLSVVKILADAFGIPPWLLLVPGLRADILDSPEIPSIVARYAEFHASKAHKEKG